MPTPTVHEEMQEMVRDVQQLSERQSQCEEVLEGLDEKIEHLIRKGKDPCKEK